MFYLLTLILKSSCFLSSPVRVTVDVLFGSAQSDLIANNQYDHRYGDKL